MNGFYIKRLIVGDGVRRAEIKLKPGANLITGASDTGKSYIFSAINHGLGRSEEPKDIVEAQGYTEIIIEIVSYTDQQVYSLHRKIGNKEITVSKASVENFPSGNPTKYTTTGSVDNTKNISFFLLSLSGLEGKKLLKNRAKGITQNLSIKTILSLTFVNETNIIKESSPYYYSAQYDDRILAQSLIHLMLTGEDFSNVVEIEDQAAKETRIRGKLEFLDSQISQFASYKDSLVDDADHTIPQHERTRFLQLDTELQTNIVEAKQIAERKNQLIIERDELLKEKRYNDELANRFQILEKQYISDENRLNFILEAKVLSDQLGDTVCPLCSSPLGLDHVAHLKEQENFQFAAVEELAKNSSKLAGLKQSIADVKNDNERLSINIEKINRELEDLQESLSLNFSVKIQSIKSDLKEYLEVENVNSEINFIDKQVKKLFAEKARLENALKNKEVYDQATILSYALLTELSERIEARLKNWNYEPHVAVNFNSDYQVFDIVISGKSRKSYGKGKRSISYAACLIGLLDLCNEKKMPFTNFLLMDSPLTTYEEKKREAVNEKDKLQGQIIQSFFSDIVNLPDNTQLIILDNKEPDAQTLSVIGAKINIIQFTGDEAFGRSGFFE